VSFASPSKTHRIAYGSSLASAWSVSCESFVASAHRRAFSLGVLKVRPSVDTRSRSPLPPLLSSRTGREGFGQGLPCTSTRSVHIVSHDLDGLLLLGAASVLQPAADHGIHHVSGRSARASHRLRQFLRATHPLRLIDTLVTSREPPGDPWAQPLFSPCRPSRARGLVLDDRARAGAARSPALAGLPDPLPRELACVRTCELPRQARPPASARSLLPRLPRPPPERRRLPGETAAAAAKCPSLTVPEDTALLGGLTPAASTGRTASKNWGSESGYYVESFCPTPLVRVRVPPRQAGLPSIVAPSCLTRRSGERPSSAGGSRSTSASFPVSRFVHTLDMMLVLPAVDAVHP